MGKIATVVALALAAVSADASAATIVQKQDFSLYLSTVVTPDGLVFGGLPPAAGFKDEVSSKKTLSFDAFNATAGTLEQVTVKLTSKQRLTGGTSFVLLYPDVAETLQTSFASGDVKLGDRTLFTAPPRRLVDEQGHDPYCGIRGAVGDICITNDVVSLDFSGTTSLALAAGQSVNIDVASELEMSGFFKSLFYQSPTHPFRSASSFDWSGQIELVYDYTPSTPSVPEPAMLGLLGASVLVAAGLRRRRSSS